MASVDHTELLFRAAPFLRDLPADLDRLLRSRMQRLRIPNGTTVFDVGSRCDLFLILLKGAIRAVALGDSGREILLYRVQPGDACVLTVGCLLGSASYPARGVAEDDVEAISIPKEVFERLVGEVPEFRRFIFEVLGERMVDLMVALESRAFRPLDQRLAAALLKQRRAEGANELAVTHQRLADDLGSSREVISRVLQAMREEGLVQLRRGGITLLDPAALGRRAESSS